MAIRAVPVPTYTTNTVADHAHILRDSGARAAIVSSPAPPARCARPARLAGGLDLLVVIDGPPDDAGGTPRLMHWADLVADAAPPDDIALEAAAIPAERAGLPDLHLRHRRRAKGVMLPHRCDPVELPRRVRAAAAAAAEGRDLSVLPAAVAQLRAHGRPVLPAQHRHRNRLLPRRRASGGRHADGAADHPDRGAARAGGDPHPRADPGGAASRRGGRRCSTGRWTSA